MSGCKCKDPAMNLSAVSSGVGLCHYCGEVVTLDHMALKDARNTELINTALAALTMYRVFAEVVRAHIPHLNCEIKGCWCFTRAALAIDHGVCECETCIAHGKMRDALVIVNKVEDKLEGNKLLKGTD